jgi:pilus assembly protein Flp/PilA
MNPVSRPIHNQRGQTLIEYLIIVALVGIGSIALMRSVSKQINVKFASVVKGLGGNSEGALTDVTVSASALRTKDMKNFAENARIGRTNGGSSGSGGASGGGSSSGGGGDDE